VQVLAGKGVGRELLSDELIDSVIEEVEGSVSVNGKERFVQLVRWNQDALRYPGSGVG
jgi:hypothetical protein